MVLYVFVFVCVGQMDIWSKYVRTLPFDTQEYIHIPYSPWNSRHTPLGCHGSNGCEYVTGIGSLYWWYLLLQLIIHLQVACVLCGGIDSEGGGVVAVTVSG